jgi:hypothetical protein
MKKKGVFTAFPPFGERKVLSLQKWGEDFSRSRPEGATPTLAEGNALGPTPTTNFAL